MIKIKINSSLKKYCLLFSALTIVSGCSTSDKRSQIVDVQKKRIVGLQKQLKKKNQIIGQMKADRWANKPVKIDEGLALRPLKKQIKKKQWVEALKTSRHLKRKYPNSVKLAFYRYSIFKKMGLKKQAMTELKTAKSLREKNRRKSTVKR